MTKKQQFTNVFREALWEAHNRKCLYCEKDIHFKELIVDHVIAESTLADFTLLTTTIRRLGLTNSFNVRGYENLAPCCEPCNSLKRDTPLADGYTSIILSRLGLQIPRVKELLDRRRQERDLDNTLRHIARSIEGKKFNADDLIAELEFLRKFPNGLRGSSPGAPPKSPEQSISGIYLDDSREVVWSEVAGRAMEEFELTAFSMHQEILRAIGSPSFRIERLSSKKGNKYVLRLDPSTRVVFSVRGERLFIDSIVVR